MRDTLATLGVTAFGMFGAITVDSLHTALGFATGLATFGYVSTKWYRLFRRTKTEIANEQRKEHHEIDASGI